MSGITFILMVNRLPNINIIGLKLNINKTIISLQWTKHILIYLLQF